MRNMSFALTTPQVRDRTKDVTRRLGWDDLMPGDRVCAVVKCQGIPKGEKVERICVIECVSNRKEMLCSITPAEVRREGCCGMTPSDFVEMFCRHNKCAPRDIVNRIEFKYVDLMSASAVTPLLRDPDVEVPEDGFHVVAVTDDQTDSVVLAYHDAGSWLEVDGDSAMDGSVVGWCWQDEAAEVLRKAVRHA